MVESPQGGVPSPRARRRRAADAAESCRRSCRASSRSCRGRSRCAGARASDRSCVRCAARRALRRRGRPARGVGRRRRRPHDAGHRFLSDGDFAVTGARRLRRDAARPRSSIRMPRGAPRPHPRGDARARRRRRSAGRSRRTRPRRGRSPTSSSGPASSAASYCRVSSSCPRRSSSPRCARTRATSRWRTRRAALPYFFASDGNVQGPPGLHRQGQRVRARRAARRREASSSRTSRRKPRSPPGPELERVTFQDKLGATARKTIGNKDARGVDRGRASAARTSARPSRTASRCSRKADLASQPSGVPRAAGRSWAGTTRARAAIPTPCGRRSTTSTGGRRDRAIALREARAAMPRRSRIASTRSSGCFAPRATADRLGIRSVCGVPRSASSRSLLARGWRIDWRPVVSQAARALRGGARDGQRRRDARASSTTSSRPPAQPPRRPATPATRSRTVRTWASGLRRSGRCAERARREARMPKDCAAIRRSSASQHPRRDAGQSPIADRRPARIAENGARAATSCRRARRSRELSAERALPRGDRDVASIAPCRSDRFFDGGLVMARSQRPERQPTRLLASIRQNSRVRHLGDRATSDCLARRRVVKYVRRSAASPRARAKDKATARRQGREPRRDGLARRSRCRPASRSRPRSAPTSRGARSPDGIRAEVDDDARGRARARRPTSASATPQNPLLVSVRSGARASMPGMMDTILNLGLNDATVEGLAAMSGDRASRWDCYRRFIAMYGDVVLGVPRQRVREAPLIDDQESASASQGDARPDRRGPGAQIVAAVKAEGRSSATGTPFPDDPRAQLWGAIGAVFRSWNNPRADVYRKHARHPGRLGHRRQRAGDGVRQPRRRLRDRRRVHAQPGDRASGRFYGEFLTNAQGEDVVAGIRTPRPLERATAPAMSLEEKMPAAYAELVRVARRSRSTSATCRTSSSRSSDGKLFMLQTRNGKRTGKATVKIAVDLVDEGAHRRARKRSRASIPRSSTSSCPDHRSQGQGGRRQRRARAGQGPPRVPGRRERARSCSPRARGRGWRRRASRSCSCAPRPRPRTSTA